jgi:hypothetical protein
MRTNVVIDDDLMEPALKEGAGIEDDRDGRHPEAMMSEPGLCRGFRRPEEF